MDTADGDVCATACALQVVCSEADVHVSCSSSSQGSCEEAVTNEGAGVTGSTRSASVMVTVPLVPLSRAERWLGCRV
mgnify:CR=1 FL=1